MKKQHIYDKYGELIKYTSSNATKTIETIWIPGVIEKETYKLLFSSKNISNTWMRDSVTFTISPNIRNLAYTNNRSNDSLSTRGVEEASSRNIALGFCF